MADFYSDGHRALQDRFDTRRLADRMAGGVVRPELREIDMRFIATSDMFFLSTVDHNGWPTVSYKGGAPGFVKVVDDRTLAFPCYDGNGMFYSMGNLTRNPKIGMLFIDFENPRRFRVHGTASLSADDPLIAEYKEACLVVRVSIVNAFTNCARYIHKFTKREISKYVPKVDAETPPAEWKRIDDFQDVLPERDRGAAERAGGVITEQEYRKDFWRGLK
jgi:predicted pyridoxine 5'-phosphate oxidase superfamily flavin-nucleotide-binding protein